MDNITLIQVGVSVIGGILGGAGIVAFKLGKYSEKVDQLEKCDFQRRLSTLEGRQLTKRNSPVDLTEFGNTVLAESTGKAFIDTNYDELKSKVEAKDPKTSYDIQEASRQVVEELKEDPRIYAIKEYLFKQGMEIEDIFEVLGIYLRNKILDERHIDRTDIDNHSKEIPEKSEKTT